MENLTLRPAQEVDSEFVYAVKKAAFRQYVEEVWGWDEEVQRRYHEERFRREQFRIINASGVDVGFLALGKEADNLHLCQLFILPKHQGKGIGSECVRLVLEEARAVGLPVRLRVLKNNPRAQALYRRLGFAQVGEGETHVFMQKAF